MTNLTKSAWTILGTDLGYRRVIESAVPTDYDHNSFYSNKVPANFAASTDYTAFETVPVFQELVTGNNGQQSATVFGKFNFGVGVKGSFFGAGVRSASSGGLLTAGYYGAVRSSESGLGNRSIYLYRVGTVVALQFTTPFPAAFITADTAWGIRIYARDIAPNVRLDVHYSVDGDTWIPAITNYLDTTGTLFGVKGNWFTIARRDAAHVPAAGDNVFLDNVTLDTNEYP